MEKINLLIVDDEPEVSGFIRLKLGSVAPHLSITEVNTARGCIEYLKSHDTDCILAGCQMPDMDGLALLKQLRAKGDTTPVIMLTAQGSEPLAREVFKNGASDYFTREMVFDNFPMMVESIEQAVGQHRAMLEKESAREAAARSSRTFADVVESIKFGMVIVGRDRLIRRANETALKMMGLTSEDEIVGRVCHNNICPADVGKCPILDLGLKVDLSEKVLLTGNGHTVPILKTVTPVVIDGEELLLETFVDITALKDAEKKVVETRAFLQSVIDGAADPIMVMDKDHTVILMNIAAGRLRAGEKAAGREHKCYQISHGVDSPCVLSGVGQECPLELVLATGEPATVVHNHAGAGGEDRWVEITASPLIDSSGDVAAVIATSRDITARMSLERERLDLQAMITHDMKGPLTAMLGYSEILYEDEKAVPDPEAREMISSIRSSGRRLSAMIDDYLAFSRLESGRVVLNMDMENIALLLEEAASDQMEAARKKGIVLETRLPDRLPYVAMDRSHLQRAVTNLIDNAINYTQKGGTVCVSAALLERAGDGELVISVTDNGPGIPAEEHARIFDRYYRLAQSARKKGSGLGLAIVKAVAEAHNGYIELDSAPGRGSTFSIVMPVQHGA